MILLSIIMIFCHLMMVFSAGHPPVEMTMDDAIGEAATSASTLDFIRDNRTLNVEFDMLMSLEDYDEYRGTGNGNGREKRKIAMERLWPGDTVFYEPIPHYFRGRGDKKIHESIDFYHKYTCVKFKETKEKTKGRIFFVSLDGCFSYVGCYYHRYPRKEFERQPVSLNLRGCLVMSIVLHELGHALGLHHEQARPDRDDFVEIMWENMDQSEKQNFEKANSSETLGVKYDVLSIMHFSGRLFSNNGKPTIVAHDKQLQNRMGRSKQLTFSDLKAVNLMYRCGGHCGNKKCPHPGYLNKKCNCMCPGDPVEECSGEGGGGGGGGQRGLGGRVGGGGGRGGGTTSGEKYHKKESGKGGRGGSGGSKCVDGDRRCRPWEQEGYCSNTRYGKSMHHICKKSCGLCKTRRSFSKREEPDICVDEFAKCSKWAKQGDCEKTPSLMYDSCRKSCGHCKKVTFRKGVKGYCEDAKPECVSLAKSGLCAKNEEYMRQTCAKSCHPACRED